MGIGHSKQSLNVCASPGPADKNSMTPKESPDCSARLGFALDVPRGSGIRVPPATPAESQPVLGKPGRRSESRVSATRLRRSHRSAVTVVSQAGTVPQTVNGLPVGL